MTRIHSCASAGIGALARAHKRALAEGGEVRLLMPTSTAVLSIFAVTGIDRLLPNFTGLDEALESRFPHGRQVRPRERLEPPSWHLSIPASPPICLARTPPASGNRMGQRDR